MFAFAGYSPTPYEFSTLYEKSIETRNYMFYFDAYWWNEYYLIFYSDAEQNYVSSFDFYL